MSTSFPVAAAPDLVPLVSVWLITYNHESYITQAIEGVLQQQTSFSVELIIGEDCSSDRTRAIVQAYQAQYPHRIRLFLAPRNLGMMPILEPTFAMCRGKYIAMLDGDDYWTDPYKLQKQIDLMEADSSCHVCFHNVQIYEESNGCYLPATLPAKLAGGSFSLDLHEIISLGNPIYTVSAVFRRSIQELPAYYYQLPYPDLAIYYLVLANNGKACYLPEVMGVYRIHDKGAFTGTSWMQKRQNSLLFFNIMQEELPMRYQQQLSSERQIVLYDLLLLSLKQADTRNAFRYFLQIDWYHLPPASPAFSRFHRYTVSLLRILARFTIKKAITF